MVPKIPLQALSHKMALNERFRAVFDDDLEVGWAGLGWLVGWAGSDGLGWAGLGWAGWWAGLAWPGLGWIGLGLAGPVGWAGWWAGLGWAGLGCCFSGFVAERLQVLSGFKFSLSLSLSLSLWLSLSLSLSPCLFV